MNIGIVSTWFERGAGYVSRQYKEILEKQNNVFIYARGGEAYAIGNEKWDSSCVTWGNRVSIPIPTAIDLVEFEAWIEKNNIEIIFFNEQHWWPPVLLCQKLNIIVGAYIDYYTEETVPLFDAYDFVICNTKKHYSVFKNHSQAYYIPWGTDTDLFKSENKNLLYKDKIVFFHSAGYSPHRKGTDLVIKAFDLLENKDKVHLIIHSQVDDFMNNACIRNILCKNENKDKIQFFQETVAAPGLYHLGDVYVYPSRLEGIGLTIAEAMAVGLPVITTDDGPMREFVVKNVSGRVVKVEKYISRADGYYWPQAIVDVGNLAEQMQWYVDNCDKIDEIKLKTRNYAEEKLNWKLNASEINHIFHNVKKINKKNFNDIKIMIDHFENRRMNILINFQLRYPTLYKILKKLRGYFIKYESK